VTQSTVGASTGTFVGFVVGRGRVGGAEGCEEGMVEMGVTEGTRSPQ